MAAVARAAGYGAWRAEPRGRLPAFTDLAPAAARELVAGFLAGQPGGGPLPPATAAGLLRCYGIALADDRMFGPLVVFGLGGPAPEMLADRAARLTPLTDADADKLIRSIRSLPLLLGQAANPAADPAANPAADLGALRDLLLRVSRLADDLPEVTELDLAPVIAGPDGAAAANARSSVTPYEPQDPFLRKLR